MAESGSISLRDCRILVVEDDYFIASDLAEALEGQGAIIIGPTGSVNGALQLASQTDPDLAVLDVNLGKETVYPLADALRARGVPFIFTTGYSSEVMPDRFYNIPRCQKPVQAASVARLLSQELAQRGDRA